MQKQRSRNAKGPREFLRDESAGTAIEYALIASVISIAIAGSASAIGSSLLDNFYNKVLEALN